MGGGYKIHEPSGGLNAAPANRSMTHNRWFFIISVDFFFSFWVNDYLHIGGTLILILLPKGRDSFLNHLPVTDFYFLSIKVMLTTKHHLPHDYLFQIDT